jgi:hypothetical protein
MSVKLSRHDVGRARAEIFENGLCGVMKRGGGGDSDDGDDRIYSSGSRRPGI